MTRNSSLKFNWSLLLLYLSLPPCLFAQSEFVRNGQNAVGVNFSIQQLRHNVLLGPEIGISHKGVVDFSAFYIVADDFMEAVVDNYVAGFGVSYWFVRFSRMPFIVGGHLGLAYNSYAKEMTVISAFSVVRNCRKDRIFDILPKATISLNNSHGTITYIPTVGLSIVYCNGPEKYFILPYFSLLPEVNIVGLNIGIVFQKARRLR